MASCHNHCRAEGLARDERKFWSRLNVKIGEHNLSELTATCNLDWCMNKAGSPSGIAKAVGEHYRKADKEKASFVSRTRGMHGEWTIANSSQFCIFPITQFFVINKLAFLLFLSLGVSSCFHFFTSCFLVHNIQPQLFFCCKHMGRNLYVRGTIKKPLKMN